MVKKPKRKPHHADADEYQRFLDMAREVEAEEDPNALDRAFRKTVKPLSTPAKKPTKDQLG